MVSSYAAYTMLAFGVTSFASGLYTLTNPTSFISNFSLPIGSEGSVRGNALAAIAMGIYYTLSVYQENRAFYLATVPMRLFTATVFSFQGGAWTVPAAWEGIGALTTAAALLFDHSARGFKKGDREAR